MILCESNRYVVYHLEKTGGTTVERSLSPYLIEGDIYIRDWQRIHVTESGVDITEHGTPDDAMALLRGSFYFTNHFATVREPVALMTSMYRYASHVYKMTPPHEAISGATMAYELSLKAGPERFLEYLFDNDFRMVRSQTSRLRNIIGSGMIVDTVNLDAAWRDITRFLGYYERIPMKRHNVSAPSDFAFSSSAVRMIKRRFEEDYDVLPEIVGRDW